MFTKIIFSNFAFSFQLKFKMQESDDWQKWIFAALVAVATGYGIYKVVQKK